MSLTSVIRYVRALDTSSTTGAGKTGLAFGDITAKYNTQGGTLTSLTTETITTLGTYQAPTSSAHIRIKELSNADPAKGVYEVHFHDSQLTDSGKRLWLYLSATGANFIPLEVDLLPFYSDVRELLGTAVSTPATAGILDVNLKNIANATVSTSSAQLGVNIVNAAGTAWNSGGITANTLAADTLTAAKIAADVWTESRTAHNGGDYALSTDANGRLRIVDGTGTGEFDTLSGTVLLRSATQTQIDTIATGVAAIEVDTQDIQSRLPAALVSGRMDSSVGAYQTGLTPLQPTVAGRTLDVNANGNAGIDWGNVDAQNTSVSLGDTSINAATSVGTIGANGINADSLHENTGLKPYTGLLDPGGSDTSLILAAGASTTDNYYRGWRIHGFDLNGTTDVVGLVTAYNGTTREITLTPSMSILGANGGESFSLVPMCRTSLGMIQDDEQSATDLKDFADAGYDPSTNKILGLVLADTVTTLTNLPAITSDWLTSTGLSTSAVQEIRNSITGGAYALNTSSNGSMRVVDGTGTDEIDLASGLVGVQAASVRTALGLASANLDTQLAAIVADTNELQTDWANGGRLDLLIDAILDDTGTSGVALSAAICNKIADHSRRRSQANVEASTDGDALTVRSLYGLIQQSQKSSVSGGTMTVKKTDGTTTLGTLAFTSSAGADPITGVA